MAWRGSTTVKDRIFACLPYLLPVIAVFAEGRFLMAQFPALGLIYLPLTPLLRIYYGVRFAGLIIFFALLLLVVRNEKISHYIRFNTMQAILLNIVIFLFAILTDVLGAVSAGDFVISTVSTTIFIGILAAVVYSIAQTIMGRYAEIPAISEAVYTQVR